MRSKRSRWACKSWPGVALATVNGHVEEVEVEEAVGEERTDEKVEVLLEALVLLWLCVPTKLLYTYLWRFICLSEMGNCY